MRVSFNAGYKKFGPCSEGVFDPVNPLVPTSGVIRRTVAPFQGGSVLLKISAQPREFFQVHQPVAIPRVNEVMPGPGQFPGGDVLRQRKWKQPGGFYQVRIQVTNTLS